MIPTITDEGQEIRAAWAAYFRAIQEELAEVRADLDSARNALSREKNERELPR